MRRVPLTPLLGLVMAFMPLVGSAQAPNGRANVLRVSLPELDWSVEVAPQFAVQTDQTRPDGRGRYVYAVDARTDLVLSIRLERGPGGRSPAECRRAGWDALRARSPFTMDAVRTGDTAPWATVEYVVPEVRGMPVRQQHLHAYFGQGNVCAEVHLSKVRVTATDQALFERALGAVRIRKVPPS